MQLSKKTKKVIKILFSIEQYERIRKLLLVDCSNNLPGCSDWSQKHLERIWLSVLKLSSGSEEQLYSAIALAQTDYRDLFMSAGFGHDLNAHNKWMP